MLALGVALVLGCNEPSGPLASPPAVGRPAEVSQGPRVGVVVALGGNVTVIPAAGPAFPAAPELQLLRDDRLVTAADSFVVVQLHNGHLVRLGANQRNVVEMLAPFHDPPAADDLEARFVRLLTPAERDDPALRGAITRVAGWNTRMSAAQTFAALPASAAPAPVTPEPPVPEAPGAADGAIRGGISPAEDVPLAGVGGVEADEERAPAAESKSRPAPKPMPAPPARVPPSDAKSKGSSRAEAPGSKGPVSPPESRAPEVEEAKGDRAEPAPRPSPQLPAQLRFTPAGGGAAQLLDLPTPLRGAVALAACAGAGAKIAGRVQGHKLVALTVDGAARCQELVGKASSLADGTFELTVKP